jgi:K+-transporting ATPase ATPase C chain
MKHIRTSLLVFIFWTIAVGGIYPLLMTGIGALFFPQKAAGSLVSAQGKVIGSRLIGQDFSGDIYFHSRPSAVNYDSSASGASNKGFTSQDLKKAYDQRLQDWGKENGTAKAPMDMLFASGSGLDPDISPEAAEGQVRRVAAARHVTQDNASQLLELVKSFERSPQLGFLGEPRVNVLELNMALDTRFPIGG